MASEQWHSWQYIGSGAIKKGTMLKLGTVAGQCDVATAVSEVPCGIALEDCAAGSTTPQHLGVGSIEGEVYKVIGSTTITIGNTLGATTGGKAVAVTLSTTYAQEWIFGVALTAAGTGGTDLVEMRYGPQIAS